ncbi:MAG: esterase/lipase family protein [Terrimicrobiaceae bacterium]
MALSRLRLGFVALALAVLSGCTTVEQRDARIARKLQSSDLVSGGRLLAEARGYQQTADRFVVCNLRAAELATQDPTKPDAVRIQAAATAALAEWFVDHQPLEQTRFTYGGLTYDLRIRPADRRGVWNPAAFKSAGNAAGVRRKLLKNWHTRPGVGAPLVVHWRPSADERLKRFATPRGYITPVTALLDFDKAPRTATLSFLDPTVIREVKIGQTERPLAADFSAPIVDRIRDVREFAIALEGVLHPGVRDAYLYTLQPYDPNRIPVVFVHGLLSHPRMWRDVINDLQADPELAGQFQYWTVFYPTGWPITFSAMRLREEMAALEKIVGPQHRMVFIGHSMGGLLSRLQVIDPGTRLGEGVLSPSDRRRLERLPSDHILRRVLTFRRNPGITRVVFISTPHRGSRMADMSVARWFSTLVRVPSTLLTTVADTGLDLASSVVGNPRELSGVRRLSPTNPLFKTLETIQIPVPHHSIIGDRGRGDTPNSSDGVVPYWSSHLDSAESEIIVPTDHGAFHDPAAVVELKRILKLQLRAQR